MTPDPQEEARRDYLRGERLSGLLLIVVGVVGFGLVYLVWLIGPLAPAAPPGIPRGFTSMLSPITCLVPVGAIGSTILILLGLRKLLFPE
jgi:hypothetical protein